MFRRRSRLPQDAPEPNSTEPKSTEPNRAEPNRAASRPRDGVNVIPTRPMLQQILDEYGLAHTIDDDGDLVVTWDNCSVYLFHYGERREVLQARLYVNRRFEVESRSSLTGLLDDWNRTKLFPKAYTVLPDDGMVGICAEHCFDFEAGTTRTALKYTVGVWIDTLLRFAEWVDDQV